MENNLFLAVLVGVLCGVQGVLLLRYAGQVWLIVTAVALMLGMIYVEATTDIGHTASGAVLVAFAFTVLAGRNVEIPHAQHRSRTG